VADALDGEADRADPERRWLGEVPAGIGRPRSELALSSDMAAVEVACVSCVSRQSSYAETIRSVHTDAITRPSSPGYCHPARHSAHPSAFFDTLLRGGQVLLVLLGDTSRACWLV